MKLLVLMTTLLCVLTIDKVEAVTENSEAMRECGNLHKLEFHSLPDAQAEYSDSGCGLKCAIGHSSSVQKILFQGPLNEGFTCPQDSNGVSAKQSSISILSNKCHSHRSVTKASASPMRRQCNSTPNESVEICTKLTFQRPTPTRALDTSIRAVF